MSFMLELKEFVATGAPTVVMTFMVFFIIVLLYGFVKGMHGMNFHALFVDEYKGRLSHTKYWANAAYLCAVVSFLTINLFYFKEAKEQIEILWLIFLGVVASNATISKLIGMKYKYSGRQEDQDEDTHDQSDRDYRKRVKDQDEGGSRGPSGGGVTVRVDNPD